jgi:hypothetical protein
MTIFVVIHTQRGRDLDINSSEAEQLSQVWRGRKDAPNGRVHLDGF